MYSDQEWEKSFRLFDGEITEEFHSITHHDDYYSFYNTIGYVSYEDFQSFGLGSVDKGSVNRFALSNITYHLCIKKNKQYGALMKAVSEKHREIKLSERENVKEGSSISMLKANYIDEPFMIDGFANWDSDELYLSPRSIEKKKYHIKNSIYIPSGMLFERKAS